MQFQAISEVSDEAIAKRLHEDHASYMRSIRRIIRRGIRQGTVREDLDVTSVVFLFDGVGVLMNMMKLLAFDGQFTAARAAALMDQLIDSIRAEPEAKGRTWASTPPRGRGAGHEWSAPGFEEKDILYTCSCVSGGDRACGGVSSAPLPSRGASRRRLGSSENVRVREEHPCRRARLGRTSTRWGSSSPTHATP